MFALALGEIANNQPLTAQEGRPDGLEVVKMKFTRADILDEDAFLYL